MALLRRGAGALTLLVLSGLAGCGPILYPAPTGQVPIAPPAQLLRLEAKDVSAVALWAPPAAGKAVVVFFHGNATDLAGMTWLAAELMNRGYGVMLIEYPGYGVAPGTPSESAIYESAARALDELKSLGVAQSRVVLVGQSLGSGVAAEMALRGYGARLLLISPFTSIPDLVDGMVPFGMGGLFATDRFDTRSKAPRLKLPTVIAQGDEDWLVPLEMAQEVADALPNSRMVVFEGGGHNDLFERDDGALLQLLFHTADAVAVPSR